MIVVRGESRVRLDFPAREPPVDALAEALAERGGDLRDPTRTGADVEYAFGAVSIGEPRIDGVGNCGILTAAVGPREPQEALVRRAC